MTTQEYTELCEAALSLDFQRIDILLEQGYTLNCVNEQDDTLLAEICVDALFAKNPHLCTIVQELLKRGADPNFRNSEHGSALQVLMWNMETQVLRVLLEAGANPNNEAGFDESESFYEYAEFDYLFQMYDYHLPEQPTEADTLTPDTWLQFLDRLAIQYQRRRPDHLFLLRQFGAKTMEELNNEI
jgi:ankyrin repeat protein